MALSLCKLYFLLLQGATDHPKVPDPHPTVVLRLCSSPATRQAFGGEFEVLYEISLMESDDTAEWEAFQRKDLFEPRRHQQQVCCG